MRRGLFAILLLSAAGVVLLSPGLAGAEVSTFIYNVPPSEMRTTGDHVYVAIQGFGSSTSPYYPVVPTKRVNYEIPYGATNVSVSVSPGGEQSLGSFHDYLMRTPPMLQDDPSYKPPAAPKQIPDVSPAGYAKYEGERVFRGHHLVEILLTPVRYTSSSGEITQVSSYIISVSYLMPMNLGASQAAATKVRSEAFEPLAREIIENYQDVNPPVLQGDAGTPGTAGGPGAPATLHDLSNPAYAIITTSTYQSIAQTLADWKTKKGTPAQVYTVSWITSNYSGYDTQEKIRNFLRLDDSTPRFDYVFLLGDTNILPVRMCKCEYDGDLVPCDYYYSDVVDGAIGAAYDWDTDNDHIWGELSGDQITWLPDTYVGRMATRSTTEATNYVNAVLSYEKNPPAGTWMKKLVFGSSFANFITADYGATDMAWVPQLVMANLLGGTGVTYDRLYEGSGICPSSFTRDFDLSATNFRDRVALGCGIAFPSGHGNYLGNYRTVWTSDTNGNGYCDTGETTTYPLCTQSYNPTTGSKRPYVLVGACLAGEMDRTEACEGDFIINNWGIGAVASSRTSYYCLEWNDPDWPWNQGQEYRWWREIFTNGKYRMGQIHGDGKYHYVQDFAAIEGGAYGPDQDDASRKNMFSSNLFGDPELPIWTAAAASLSVTHNATLPKAPSTYTVTVLSGGSPLADATVCLWKGTEVYLVQNTNGSGVATFSPSPTTTGTMYVTVTKHNYIPYEGSATVQEVTDTTPPTVTVNAPNGGEVWAISSGHNVTWTATDNVGVTSVTLVLSKDGGSAFPDTLAKGLANSGTYLWTVPTSPTTTARIKAVAYDAAGNSGSDMSDANFQILDATAPTATVSTPNGGEVWEIGTAYSVAWTATDNIAVTTVTLVLSRDGGVTFPDTLAKGEANDGAYSWTVSGARTLAARIKVIAYDAAGNSGSDVSDADFQIYDPASGVPAGDEIPDHLVIEGTMPNPSSDRTIVRFGLPTGGRIEMAVFDVSGREIASLADGQYPAGYHEAEWRSGSRSGIYFVQLRLGGERVTHKIVISR